MLTRNNITPLEFFSIGICKDKVFKTPTFTLQQLRDRITQAFKFGNWSLASKHLVGESDVRSVEAGEACLLCHSVEKRKIQVACTCNKRKVSYNNTRSLRQYWCRSYSHWQLQIQNNQVSNSIHCPYTRRNQRWGTAMTSLTLYITATRRFYVLRGVTDTDCYSILRLDKIR